MTADNKVFLLTQWKFGMWLEKEDLWRAVKESSCIMFVCQWMEVSEIFMMYIGKSGKCPIGKAENIWW
jgi:hypothetical protein